MATVTSIADAMAAVIAGVANVNYVSVDSFLPTVQATTAAVMIVPFAQETVAAYDTFNADGMAVSHRMAIEVWTRYRPDNIPGTMDVGRDVALSVLAAIYGSDGTGYTLARERESTIVNEDGFREIATGLVFLVSRLGVWVDDTIAV